MENASKALIMAGGVLIGIVLFSILVYAFRYSGNFAKQYDDKLAQQDITKFNEQFLSFEGRKDVTIHEIISLINLSENYNEKEGSLVVDVMIDGRSYITKQGFDENAKIDELQKNTSIYACLGVEYDRDTNKINMIKFRHI